MCFSGEDCLEGMTSSGFSDARLEGVSLSRAFPGLESILKSEVFYFRR